MLKESWAMERRKGKGRGWHRGVPVVQRLPSLLKDWPEGHRHTGVPLLTEQVEVEGQDTP